MKTIKVTYTETYYVTEERVIEVSDKKYKQLQKEDSEEYQKLLDEMSDVTCIGDSHTERDLTYMYTELATNEEKETYLSLDF